MTFQPKTIQKSMPATFHILCNRRRSTYGPQIPIQDIKNILYQMISFLQFKQNHCFYFLCCNNYNSRLYSNQGLTGPSRYFLFYFRYEVIVISPRRFGFWSQIFYFPRNQKMFERRNSQRCCRHRRF